MMGIILSAVLLVLLVVLLLGDIRRNRAGLIFVLRLLMILLVALVLSGFIFRRSMSERPTVRK